MTSTGTSPRRPVRTLILTSLAAASLALLATPGKAAAASPVEGTAAITVYFGDLNLHSHDGIDELYQRIAAAAERVCGGDTETRSLDTWSQVRICTRQSIVRAVAMVGIPELLALCARKNGHPIDNKVLLTKR